MKKPNTNIYKSYPQDKEAIQEIDTLIAAGHAIRKVTKHTIYIFMITGSEYDY